MAKPAFSVLILTIALLTLTACSGGASSVSDYETNSPAINGCTTDLIPFANAHENYEREIIVVATVNGDNIYLHQLDSVVNQLPYGEISRYSVLHATIRELVVIQKGLELGFSVTDDDLSNILYMYQYLLPEIFEVALAIYGYNDLADGLRMRRIFETTRAYIIQTMIIPYVDINDDVLMHHLQNIGATTIILNDESRYYIVQSYMQYIERRKFDQFVNELYEKSNIIYLNQHLIGGISNMDELFFDEAQLRRNVEALDVRINTIALGTGLTPPPPMPGTYRESWSWKQVVDYLGLDIIPIHTMGMMPSSTNDTHSILFGEDGLIINDVITLTYFPEIRHEDDIFSARGVYPSLFSLRIFASKMFSGGNTNYIWPNNILQTEINGVSVSIGHFEMPMSLVLDGSEVYHDLYVAKFIRGDVLLQVVSHALDRDIFLSVVYQLTL